MTYIRAQVNGVTGTIPAVGDYFEYGFGLAYDSGGTPVTPVNTNAGSSNAAVGSFYRQNPTLTGAFVQLDEWWPAEEAAEEIWRKEGSIIIPTGKALTIRYVSATTAGTTRARISFLQVDPHDTIIP